jgi:16S rRNA (guanine1207-N2)-methyltransferase
MSHYFSNQTETLKSNPKRIAFRAVGMDFYCNTDNGVFSKNSLDRGTKVLLEFLEVNPAFHTALDLGCGYGPIGLVLSKRYQLQVDMIDVNARAIELAKSNVILNKTKANVIESDGVSTLDKKYDIVVTNPPIRVGKIKLYELLDDAYSHLLPNGELWFVINKKHGALSAVKHMSNICDAISVIGKSKGFMVVRCIKTLTP